MNLKNEIGEASQIMSWRIFWQKNKAIAIYSVSLALTLYLLNWLQLRLLIFHHSFEIYFGSIALIFTILGIWLFLKLSKPKTEIQVVEKEFILNANETPDASVFPQPDLSKRELQILILMAEGHSNREIADKLFISVSTVKTGIQQLFEKLEVNRRTKAVDKARTLNLIP